jgi:hypothetical protein
MVFTASLVFGWVRGDGAPSLTDGPWRVCQDEEVVTEKVGILREVIVSLVEARLKVTGALLAC